MIKIEIQILEFCKEVLLQLRVHRVLLFMLFLLLFSGQLYTQIILPRLISDGVVFQRDQPNRIWGWASPGEPVVLRFLEHKWSTQANASGRWSITLPPQQFGGPYNMVIVGHNTVELKNILFGDVWICSGQSNMELTMERVKEKYRSAIEESENMFIRQFEVPDKYDFKNEHVDLDGGKWAVCTPGSIMEFSAVAYFFAREMYNRNNIPVAIINVALGGSPVEAWMSEDALEAFPHLYSEMQKFKDDLLIERIETEDRSNQSAWYSVLNQNDPGLDQWHSFEYDDSIWNTTQIPGFWQDHNIKFSNGSMWFRKNVEFPSSMAGQQGSLWLGRIVDADYAYINGHPVGSTSYQYPPRRYSFSEGVLKEGVNTIAVRVINSSGLGGFVPDKPYFLSVGTDTLDLKGVWKYKEGAAMKPIQGQTFIRWKPGGLYNRMIAPLIPFSIKGVLWYQGESNTRNPSEYRMLFPALINNWREKWGLGEFPFLYVQLPNFMESKPHPEESNWAALRQVQLETLTTPNTGMAVGIDLGEWNDIHPLNKKDVGERLALVARAVVYGEEDIVYSGPLYKNYTIDGNKIKITFTHTGSGLVAKGDHRLHQFAIAGVDKKFVWAQAIIQGDNVVVWSDEIKDPKYVRYAWANNPEGANLYNVEGLPASPFTTEK